MAKKQQKKKKKVKPVETKGLKRRRKKPEEEETESQVVIEEAPEPPVAKKKEAETDVAHLTTDKVPVKESSTDSAGKADDTLPEVPDEEDMEHLVEAERELLADIDHVRKRGKRYKQEKAQELYVGNRAPGKELFFQVHPDEAYFVGNVDGYRPGSDRDKLIYLPGREVKPFVENDSYLYDLYFCQDLDGSYFYWNIKSEDNSDELDNWNKSAHRAAEQAKEKWIRLVSGGNEYKAMSAEGEIPDPIWDEALTPKKAFKLAYQDYIILDPLHPVIKRLRGIL